MFSRFSPAVPAILPALVVVAAFAAPGCGGSAPTASVSKVVAADSEEGRKAQADDEAHRQMLRQREAKAVLRKRGLQLPDEG